MNCMKSFFRSLVPFAVTAASMFLIPNIVWAGITFSGDYGPTDTSTWDAYTDTYIGTLDSETMTTGVGSVAITSGSTLTSGHTYLGCLNGSSGSVTINGGRWCPNRLFLGSDGTSSGTGTVVVTGGSLTVGCEEYIPWSGTYKWNSGMLKVGSGIGSVGSLKINGGYCDALSIVAGEDGQGLIELSGGGTLDSRFYAAGFADGSSGTITVDGAGSILDAAYLDGTGYVTIGGCSAYSGGTGTLNITNGGYVTSGQTTIDSYGTLNLSAGSNLDTRSLYIAETAGLSGSGAIYTQGLVSDLDLTFDSYTGNYAILSIGSISLTVDLSDTTGSVRSALGAGFRGSGTLVIRDAVNIYTMEGSVGSSEGGSGTATVDGATWTIAQGLDVSGGDTSTALLDITNGGLVTNNISGLGLNCVIGHQGTVTVDATSQLICNAGDLEGYLTIGPADGSAPSTDVALLQINGGSVSATETYLGTKGTISFGAGGGTLNTEMLTLEATNLSGAGQIQGVVGLGSDLNLLFDASHSAHQTLTFGSVTLDLDLSDPDTARNVGVGERGAGSMMIKDGVAVYSATGYLGNKEYASGTVTIDGGTWSCNGDVNVAYGTNASGMLQVTNGGVVSTSCLQGGWNGTATVSFNNGTLKVVEADGGGGGWLGDFGGAYTPLCMTNLTHAYIGAGGLTVNTNGIDCEIDQMLEDDPASTGGGLTKVGLGILVVSGTNTYTGNTVINQGMLASATPNALPNYGTSGKLTIANGAALGLPTYYTTQRWDWILGQYVTTEHGWTPTAITDLLNANNSGFAAGSTLVLDTSGADYTFSGSMAGNYALAVTGGNVLTLSGANSYTGSTTIEAGAISFASKGAMVAWDNSQTTATVSVADGATLAVYVSDTDGTRWSAADLAVLALGNAGTNTGAVTFHSGSALGVDTTLGDFNCDVVLPLAGTMGLKKLGANTLVLGGTQTYAGPTTVCVGALVAVTPDALPGYNQADRIMVQSEAAIGGRMSVGGGPGWTPADFDALFNANGFNIWGSLAIDTTNGDYVYSVALPTSDSSVGLLKLGDNTLTLTAANTYTGLTTVKAGTFELGESSHALVLTGGGADIQAGKIVFDYTSTAPDVGTLMLASYGTGGTTAWTSGQFLCSTADTAHGLGWIDNGTGQVTVMYTLYGDANCDGSVNGTDLNAVLSYYNQSGEIWENGDFNYDGSVNGTDLNSVLSNYNQSLSNSTAAVPEPSTLLLMVLASLCLLVWRKCQ